MSFDTPLALAGPFREPRQMLADQEYGGHSSIHDDAMAEKLASALGRSRADALQPVPATAGENLGPGLVRARLYLVALSEHGCGREKTRAFAEIPAEGVTSTRVWAEKADGTPVLEASASIGADETLLEKRMAALRPPGKLLILEDLSVGMSGAKTSACGWSPIRTWARSIPSV